MGWAATIDHYASWGIQLIPLDPFAREPRHRGKKPLDAQWTTRSYTRSELLLWAMQGGLHNLGAQLGSTDLVLDVDPRHGGDKSYDQLLKDTKLDMSEYPTVATGGGGLHIYTVLDDTTLQFSNEISDYPGIEWKHIGQQVVVPGGLHPETGDYYRWANDKRERKVWPAKLKELLATYQYSAASKTEISAISPEELTAILEQLPVDQYDSNASWFKVLAASYHSTAGAGRDEFIEWSTSDPRYQEHTRVIASRWKSLESAKASRRSLGSLVYELDKHGGKLPESLLRTHKNLLDGYEIKVDVESVTASVGALGPKSPAAEIKKVLRQVSQMDPLDAGDLLEVIRQQTGRTKTAIAHTLKALQSADRKKNADAKMIDVPYDVAHQVLKVHFEDGRMLLHALDGRYWRYVGTHWEPYSANQIKGLIKTAAEQYREQNPTVKFLISSTIVSAEIVIRAATATGVDLLGAKNELRAIVNCRNCELWINEDGSADRREHKPESHLTHCLPIEYDPKATCDLYDETLRGIFEPLDDTEDVIRHLWDVLGYTIQPAKTIPCWFLLQGGGANGKTLILDVLIALLGPTARSIASISELTASKSEYALSECVGALAIIDDDVKKGALLNDDVLKKISENKTLRSRFMRGDFFEFRNSATVFLAANSWPQTSDLSVGMRRRAFGFPFRRQFKHDGDRKKQIIGNELSGILNRALEGLSRVKARGCFDVPPSCLELIDQWMSRSNQILGYLGECHDGGKWAGYKDFNLVWEGYQHWSRESGYRRGYSRPGFREALVSYGILDTDKGLQGVKGRQRPGSKTCAI